MHLSIADMAALAPDLFRADNRTAFFKARKAARKEYPIAPYQVETSLSVGKHAVTASAMSDKPTKECK